MSWSFSSCCAIGGGRRAAFFEFKACRQADTTVNHKQRATGQGCAVVLQLRHLVGTQLHDLKATHADRHFLAGRKRCGRRRSETLS